MIKVGLPIFLLTANEPGNGTSKQNESGSTPFTMGKFRIIDTWGRLFTFPCEG